MSERPKRGGAAAAVAGAVMSLLGRGGAASGPAASAGAGGRGPSAEPSPAKPKAAARATRSPAAPAKVAAAPVVKAAAAAAAPARQKRAAERGTAAEDVAAGSLPQKDANRAPPASKAAPSARAPAPGRPPLPSAAPAPLVVLSEGEGSDEDADRKSDSGAPARSTSPSAPVDAGDGKQQVEGGDDDVQILTAAQAAAEATKRGTGGKRYRAMEKPDGCPGDLALLRQVRCPLGAPPRAICVRAARRWRWQVHCATLTLPAIFLCARLVRRSSPPAPWTRSTCPWATLR